MQIVDYNQLIESVQCKLIKVCHCWHHIFRPILSLTYCFAVSSILFCCRYTYDDICNTVCVLKFCIFNEYVSFLFSTVTMLDCQLEMHAVTMQLRLII